MNIPPVRTNPNLWSSQPPRVFLFLDMTYHVYILLSLSNGSYYIGYTKDLNKRFLQHNKAKTGYSAKKIPWELVYSESFDDKTEAILRERFIKAQKSRDFIRRLISNQCGLV